MNAWRRRDAFLFKLRDVGDEREGQIEGLEAKHVVLLLDKHIQMFPWESCPSLRRLSVSRLPTFSLLWDRLRTMHDDLEIDATRTFYVLNPSGDLSNTQHEFREFLQRQVLDDSITTNAHRCF